MQIDSQLLQAMSIIVAIISIVVAFIIGIRSIRNFSTSRKASVFISYQTQAYDKELMRDQIEIVNDWSWKDVDDFRHKYGPQANPEAYAKFVSVAGFYEGLARLLRKGIIDDDLIPEMVAVGIVMFHEKTRSIQKDVFGSLVRQESADLLDYLYNRIKPPE
ncbi:MAG: hypothetical protein JSV94_06845 [Methanobacteriota archaeon]|nr:MAG: hypothetical protein JSV94_06845 [Euryarchaeota archaeon]